MIISILIGIVCTIDLYVALRLYLTLQLLRMSVATDKIKSDLPTVSICIPARDETHAMTQCLERVVASEYSKLEIIVLNDGSRDDTSILIKSFAHAGVRFIEGKPLPDGWLGKNYAQSVLAEEASGELVFFMDVDTLIERHTIERIVGYYVENDVKMVSVLPIRNDYWTMSTLFTTMRHFWTLMRFTPKHPRAVANAWLVDRKFILEQLKNDTRLPLSVQMETTLAETLAKSSSYRLVLSDKNIGLRYEKKWQSQVETSIRLLFPQCGKNWIGALWLAFLLGLSLIPYVLVWFTLWALIPIVIQYVVAHGYLSRIWVHYRLVGTLLLPLTIVQEIVLVMVSAYLYSFRTVTWKGRPIEKKTA